MTTRKKGLGPRGERPARKRVPSTPLLDHSRSIDAFRDAESRIRAIVETYVGGTIGIWDWNIETGEIYLSDRWRELLDITPNELKSDYAIWMSRMHPDDEARVVEALRAHLEERRPYDVEYRMRLRSGQYRWFRSTGQAKWNAAGRAIRMSGSNADVTERHRVEDELRASEARFKNLFESAPDGILLVRIDSPAAPIEDVNSTAAVMHGYEQRELRQMRLQDLLASRADGLDGERLRRLRRGDRLTYEAAHRRKDGSLFPVEIEARLVTVGGQDHILIFGRDITERRRVESALRATEKLAATGRMAARVAHEINNPLGAIKNAFHLLKGGINPSHPYFKHVALIDGELVRIQHIIHQMLGLYRPAAQRPAEFSICRLIRNVIDLLAAKARHHDVSLLFRSPRQEIHVCQPEGPVSQILFNFLTNACEASPPGEIVSVGVRVDDGLVRLEVRDRGHGIPEAVRARLFEPFFTTKTESNSGGLGLGLSVSRSLAESMDGTVGFECPESGGAIFWLCMPQSIEAACTRPAAFANIAETTGLADNVPVK